MVFSVFSFLTSSSDSDSSRGSRRSSRNSYRIRYPIPQPELYEEEIPFPCARIFLTIVNFVFFVGGFGMIIMATIALAEPAACAYCFAALTPLVLTGSLVAVISSFGLSGAVFNSYKFLLVYANCVVILLLIQVIVFCWSLCGHNDFRRRVQDYLTEKMRTRPQDLIPMLEILQSNHECCGVNGPVDYRAVGLKVPRSCCSSPEGGDCSFSDITSAPNAPVHATTEAIVATTKVTNFTFNSTFLEIPRNETQMYVGNSTILSWNVSGLNQRVLDGHETPATSSGKLGLGTNSQLITNASLNDDINSTLPGPLFSETGTTDSLEPLDMHHVKS